MSGDLIQVLTDDETKPGTQKVGRLTEMDTKEVSLVDRAANKRTFLMVKRDEGNDMPASAMTGASTIQPTDVAITDDNNAGEQITVKSSIFLRVGEALDRVDTVKSAVEAAPLAKDETKDSALDSATSQEIRAIQFMLKSLAGITSKAWTFLVPCANDLSQIGEVTKAVKDNAIKVLDEVGTRLRAIKADVEKVSILDVAQARKVDSTADLLATIPHATAKSVVILRTSLSDPQRAMALDSIEKAMTGLCDVYVALQTDGIVAKANVADHVQVGSVLTGHASLVEKAVQEILAGSTSDAEIVKIVKAASMFQHRTNWDLPDGDANKYQVRLVTEPEPPKLVASFATRTEAKLDSMKRNFELATGVATAKADTGDYKVKPGGKGFQVLKGEDVVFDTPNQIEAQVIAVSKAMETEAPNSDAAAATTDTTKQEDGVTATKTKTDTTKVGSPMKGSRLSRLKSTVTLLKETILALRSVHAETDKAKAATASAAVVEKLQQVGIDMDKLLLELQVLKRGAAAATGGVEDTRSGTDASAPNMGSGLQPDTGVIGTMDDVMGEGTQGTAELLKGDETAKQQVAKAKDAEIAKLKKEMATLKKVKGAPSAPPTDGEDFAYVEKGDDDVRESLGWPSDMNDYGNAKTN